MNIKPTIKNAVLHGIDQPMTTSIDVAKAFRKRHADVLRAIRNMKCSPDFNQRNFASVALLDNKGEKRPMIQMTKDGFMFLVMGFTGVDADAIKEAYIYAFNAMTYRLSNQWVELNKTIQQLSSVEFNLSDAGRTLVVLGKQVKPTLERRIDHLINHLQLPLILEVAP